MSYDQAAFADTKRILDELGSSPDGLSAAEANIRLQEFGPNVLPSAKKVNFLERFASQFRNLFNVLLIIASSLSFFSGWVYNDAGSIQMGLAILSVVVLNAFFSLFQEYRAERAVQAIARLVPSNAKVLRDGKEIEVDIAKIVQGDILVLEEGDRVPADARLISAFETSVDNSILTGESDPQRRFATMAPGPIYNMTDYQNVIFAGTTIVSGIARAIVLKTGKSTEFGKIVTLSREIKEPSSPRSRKLITPPKSTSCWQYSWARSSLQSHDFP